MTNFSRSTGSKLIRDLYVIHTKLKGKLQMIDNLGITRTTEPKTISPPFGGRGGRHFGIGASTRTPNVTNRFFYESEMGVQKTAF